MARPVPGQNAFVVGSVCQAAQSVVQAQVRHRLEIAVVLLVAPLDPDEQKVNDLTRPACRCHRQKLVDLVVLAKRLPSPASSGLW